MRLTAAVTAPHRVCPMTRISFAPATAQPYSTLASTFRLVTLPAMRTLKMSPMPKSKISSAGVRESMQLSTTAKGCCPSAVARTWRPRSRVRRRPLRNRS